MKPQSPHIQHPCIQAHTHKHIICMHTNNKKLFFLLCENVTINGDYDVVIVLHKITLNEMCRKTTHAYENISTILDSI